MLFYAFLAFENARHCPIQRGSYIQSLHKTDSDRRASSTTKFFLFNFNKILSYFRRQNVFTDGTAEKLLEQYQASILEQETTTNSMQQFFQLEQVLFKFIFFQPQF